MLLVLTIALVAVAVVTLVVGYASSSVGWIYVSIACSALAAVVLSIFSRLSKRPAVVSGAVVGVPVPPPTPLFAPEPAGVLEEDPAEPSPAEGPSTWAPAAAAGITGASDDDAMDEADASPGGPDERHGRLSGPA